jgi:hypothetical protein
MTLMETAQLLGNLGEFVGAIAVVVTLGYLATQVRHSRVATEANTKQLQSGSLQNMTERLHNRLLFLAADPVAADLTFRMSRDPDSLSEMEQFQAVMLIAANVTDLEEAYRQVGLGTLPEAALNSRVTQFKQTLQSPFVAGAWESLRKFPDPEFQRWADSEFADQSADQA